MTFLVHSIALNSDLSVAKERKRPFVVASMCLYRMGRAKVSVWMLVRIAVHACRHSLRQLLRYVLADILVC